MARAGDGLGERPLNVAALLHEVEDDVLAYMAFPAERWRRIHSTNVLERLNRELARRLATGDLPECGRPFLWSDLPHLYTCP